MNEGNLLIGYFEGISIIQPMGDIVRMFYVNSATNGSFCREMRETCWLDTFESISIIQPMGDVVQLLLLYFNICDTIWSIEATVGIF